MDILQQLHDVLNGVVSHLKDTGEQVYQDTAAKVEAKIAELRPLLADDVADVEQRATEFIHQLFA